MNASRFDYVSVWYFLLLAVVCVRVHCQCAPLHFPTLATKHVEAEQFCFNGLVQLSVQMSVQSSQLSAAYQSCQNTLRAVIILSQPSLIYQSRKHTIRDVSNLSVQTAVSGPSEFYQCREKLLRLDSSYSGLSVFLSAEYQSSHQHITALSML